MLGGRVQKARKSMLVEGGSGWMVKHRVFNQEAGVKIKNQGLLILSWMNVTYLTYVMYLM